MCTCTRALDATGVCLYHALGYLAVFPLLIEFTVFTYTNEPTSLPVQVVQHLVLTTDVDPAEYYMYHALSANVGWLMF